MKAMRSARLPRRQTLATLLSIIAILGLSACDGKKEVPKELKSSANELVTIRISYIPIADAANLIVADTKGYFKEVGINAILSTETSGAAIIQKLTSGAADIGYASPHVVGAAYSKGIPIKILAPANFYDRSKNQPTGMWAVPKNSSASSFKDLTGKNLGVIAFRSMADLAYHARANDLGMDPKSILTKEVAFGEIGSQLASGTLNASFVTEPMTTGLLDRGEIKALEEDAYAGLPPRFMITAWIAHDNWLTKDSKGAMAFANAIAKANDWINGNEAETRKIIASYTNIDQEVVNKMRLSVYSNKWSTEDVRALTDAAAKYGFFSKFDAKELIAAQAKIAN